VVSGQWSRGQWSRGQWSRGQWSRGQWSRGLVVSGLVVSCSYLMRDYTKIDAWKLADDLTVTIYERTRSFPKEELYGLTSQLRRAAYSVPANIVEGSSRETKRDYLHFLYIARSSLSEAQYFIHLAHRLGYMEDEDAEEFIGQTKSAFACLHGLIKSVEKEAGKLGKTVAVITSAVFLFLSRFTTNA
jgi:four helix bundle protein